LQNRSVKPILHSKYFDGIISFYSIVYTPRIYIDQLLQKFVTSLKPKGKLLLVVKEGDTEGYIDEILGIKTNAYFTYFKEIEIKDYLIDNGFDVKYLFTREPMDFEIAVKRIYAIGEKIE
jgi:SAM-dependent methyltransferase